VFLSTYDLKLDEKGRFFLPTRFRPAFSAGLIVVQGHERCLAVYDPVTFETEANKALALQSWYKDVREYQRMLGADAWEGRPDKQGRVSLSAKLREYAHLDKDIVVTGALDHVEIWNLPDWYAYKDDSKDDYSDLDRDIGKRPSDG